MILFFLSRLYIDMTFTSNIYSHIRVNKYISTHHFESVGIGEATSTGTESPSPFPCHQDDLAYQDIL